MSFTIIDTFISYSIRVIKSDMNIHDNITDGSDVMTEVNSGDDYYLWVNTPTSVPLVSYSPSFVTTLTEITLSTIVVVSEKVGDIAYYETPIDIGSIAASTSGSFSTDFTCSISGNTSISYSITDTNGSVAPSWISADSSNQEIDYTTPFVTAATSYTFQLVASWLSENRNTSILIVVTASDSSSSDGSDTVKDIRAILMLIIFLCFLAVVASTATRSMGGGSSQGMWSMINQFQFYLLLPLLGAYIPEEFLDFLQGYSFVLFNFNFIKIPSLPVYKDLTEYFDCGNYNSYLKSIGIESK